MSAFSLQSFIIGMGLSFDLSLFLEGFVCLLLKLELVANELVRRVANAMLARIENAYMVL